MKSSYFENMTFKKHRPIAWEGVLSPLRSTFHHVFSR